MKKIIYIDEEEEARDLYSSDLKNLFGVEVEAIPPVEDIIEMSTALIDQHPTLIALIFDEKLNTSGDVTYTGIDLVSEVRKTLDKLPIYMFTNVVDLEHFAPNDWQIDYVISKGAIKDQVYIKKVKTIALRYTSIYSKVLEERELRFEGLLQKHIQNTLSLDEQEEFSRLSNARVKPAALVESIPTLNLKEKLDSLEEKLNCIEQNLKD